eukprot:SAG11_NODE_11881_length_733_cov_1.736593_1_plen_31_part_01
MAEEYFAYYSTGQLVWVDPPGKQSWEGVIIR